jgi:uncharacterized LabA/DUF88 family protein
MGRVAGCDGPIEGRLMASKRPGRGKRKVKAQPIQGLQKDGAVALRQQGRANTARATLQHEAWPGNGPMALASLDRNIMKQKQIAVLVDAGYFFAQSSETLFGGARPRLELDLHEKLALDMIRAKALAAFPGREMLRVYWYDAPPSRSERMSSSQERMGLMPGVKLRLGALNGAGQQKGVDALICRDIEDLARKQAVDSIMLVSGDEDLRLAVEEAQSHGVKVSLLGVGPGHASIGMALMMESDGMERLEREDIVQFLAQRQARAGDHQQGQGRDNRPASKSARKRSNQSQNSQGHQSHHGHNANNGVAAVSSVQRAAAAHQAQQAQHPKDQEAAGFEPAPVALNEPHAHHPAQQGAQAQRQEPFARSAGEKRRGQRNKNRPGQKHVHQEGQGQGQGQGRVAYEPVGLNAEHKPERGAVLSAGPLDYPKAETPSMAPAIAPAASVMSGLGMAKEPEKKTRVPRKTAKLNSAIEGVGAQAVASGIKAKPTRAPRKAKIQVDP